MHRAYNIKFMKLRPVRVGLFHADGRPERYNEANTRFSQNCEKRIKTQNHGFDTEYLALQEKETKEKE
jgi:hypothetical protein